MRNTDVLLDDLPDVLTLCQYLYMKEENCVEVPGAVPGTVFRLSMDEELNIVSRFKPKFGDRESEFMPPAVDREMTVKGLLNVVDNLKEMPAVEFPKSFKNRWDEVRTIALGTVATNRMKRRS